MGQGGAATGIVRPRKRRARRLVLVGVVLALATTALGTVSSAAPTNTPYTLAGTVSEDAAPIDPTNVPGSNAAFILTNYTEVSSSAQPYAGTQATIYATPQTKFY